MMRVHTEGWRGHLARLCVFAGVVLGASSLLEAQGPPRLVPVSGVLRDAAGAPRAGTVTLTLALYEEADGGAPLWAEEQPVVLDAGGRYTVTLGAAADGLPADLFGRGLARWLGVRVAGEAEEPRRQLLAVPYAVAAHQAAMLAGRPAADFARAEVLKETVHEVVAEEADAGRLAGAPGEGAQATPNQIPKFTSSGGAIDDSVMTDAAGGVIGVGTTAPNYLLQLHAASGGAALQLTNAATGTGALDGARLEVPAGDTALLMVNQEAAPVEFYTNAVRRVTIDGAGKVGIGIDGPNSLTQLHSASGHALVQMTNATTGSAAGDGGYVGVLAGDPTLRILNQEVGGIEVFTAAERRLTIDGNGKIGLGTRTPGSLFHLHAPFGHTLLQFTNATTGSAATDGAYVGVLSGSRTFRIVNQENASIEFARGNTVMTVTSAGNLEINMANGNTAIGANALDNVEQGSPCFCNNTADNTAVGEDALTNFTQGDQNTAFGYGVLFSNVSGVKNTAVGAGALSGNTTGSENVAFGDEALDANTTGNRNVAVGRRALANATSGSDNIAIGRFAGLNQTTGSNNIYIGHQGVAGESGTVRIGTPGAHTHAFIGGIRGITTGLGDAVVVVVDSAGQLGTIASSARYKQDIADMGTASRWLSRLRPVTFRYRQPLDDGSKPLRYGLLAEEVATVMPNLVVFDADGWPETVRYHKLDVLLLNELQAQQRLSDDARHAGAEEAARIARQGADLAARRLKLEALAARVRALAVRRD